MEGNGKSVRQFQKKVGKAIQEFSLIEPNEKILVGLSGGIDSMSLAHVLKKRSLLTKQSFIVEAIHITIDGVPNEVNTNIITSFCSQHDIKLNRLSLKIDYSTDSRNSPCYLCSSYRRNAVFRFAQENGFNKLAFGHHMDDILETLLMNMTSQAEISTMPPLLNMKNWEFDLIRPLSLITKDEIKNYASAFNIEAAEGSCAFEEKNSRSKINQVLELFSEINPQSKVNLFNSMRNIAQDYLAIPKSRNAKPI